MNKGDLLTISICGIFITLTSIAAGIVIFGD